MADTRPLRPIVILGPTAGGKSEFAVGLAQRLGGEVLGADSMQVYRHLDAGTAKPPRRLRARIAHHLIDIVEPTRRFTVADWLQCAQATIADLQAKGVVPIVVGGSNLYIRMLLEGMFQGPPTDDAFRLELADVPAPELHARLARVDPDAAARIHPNDRKRLTRALEVHASTGHRISRMQTQWDQPPLEDRSRGSEFEVHGSSRETRDVHRGSPIPDPRSPISRESSLYRHDPLLIGLRWPTDLINQRINLRVKAMFYPDRVDPDLAEDVCPNGGQSLPEEVRSLVSAGLLGPQARQALGYKQVLQWMDGHFSLQDAFEQTRIRTRRFAKQQRTWLRRFRGVHWVDASQSPSEELVARAVLIAEAGAS